MRQPASSVITPNTTDITAAALLAAKAEHKRRLVDEIREINASAEESFLMHFNESALIDYLDRLQNAHVRRVRLAGWVQRRVNRYRKAG